LVSGNLAMSSARMVSVEPVALRFSSSDLSKLAGNRHGHAFHARIGCALRHRGACQLPWPAASETAEPPCFNPKIAPVFIPACPLLAGCFARSNNYVWSDCLIPLRRGFLGEICFCHRSHMNAPPCWAVL
jgi:hypothetical protein